MKPVRFSAHLLCCLLLAFAPLAGVWAQADRVVEYSWAIYRTNPAVRTITVPASDTLAPYTATVYYGRNDRLLPAPLQPALSRSGRVLTVSFTGLQTSTMPETAFIEVRRSGITFVVFNLTVSRQTITALPGSLTLITVGGGDGSGGGGTPSNVATFREYEFSNAVSGTIITHGQVGCRIVGTVIRSDTGEIDLNWYYRPTSETTGVLRGPPGETLPGTLYLTFFKRLTQ